METKVKNTKLPKTNVSLLRFEIKKLIQNPTNNIEYKNKVILGCILK